MKIRSVPPSVLSLVAVACIAAACTGPQGSAGSGQPSVPAASVGASEASASALEGTWTTPETTCDEQNAALTRAEFSSADLELAGWDEATCGGMMHGNRFSLRFAGDRLVVLQDDEVGWDGLFRVVDADTFEAGDGDAGFYIEYAYELDGDELTIDMVRNDYSTSSEEELTGELLAQTVIYETTPFLRQP